MGKVFISHTSVQTKRTIPQHIHNQEIKTIVAFYNFCLKVTAQNYGDSICTYLLAVTCKESEEIEIMFQQLFFFVIEMLPSLSSYSYYHLWKITSHLPYYSTCNRWQKISCNIWDVFVHSQCRSWWLYTLGTESNLQKKAVFWKKKKGEI